MSASPPWALAVVEVTVASAIAKVIDNAAADMVMNAAAVSHRANASVLVTVVLYGCFFTTGAGGFFSSFLSSLSSVSNLISDSV
jgi:hypothetical protein